jgi:hypothetical protein
MKSTMPHRGNNITSSLSNSQQSNRRNHESCLWQQKLTVRPKDLDCASQGSCLCLTVCAMQVATVAGRP